MKTLGIIPARFASTRFPGKVLVDIKGQSMLERVYHQVQQTQTIDAIVVATDDERILNHVQSFGGTAVMTRIDHRSGTDRCAEVVSHLPDVGIVVNIQGDEPLIDPSQIDLVVESLRAENALGIASLAKQIEDEADIFNPNVVKVVFDQSHRALYFSRQTLPYVRGKSQSDWKKSIPFFKHIGLYGFKKEVLLAISQLPAGQYEMAEGLEQLRWMEAGYAIQLRLTEKETIGVDTPEDLKKIEALIGYE